MHHPHMTNIVLKHVIRVIYLIQILQKVDGKPHVVVVEYYSFFICERPMPDVSSDMLTLAPKTFSVSQVYQTFLLQTMEGSIFQKNSRNLT